ncbi:MAG: mannosyltransferase family protein, partial [Actinomycetota bacterium]
PYSSVTTTRLRLEDEAAAEPERPGVLGRLSPELRADLGYCFRVWLGARLALAALALVGVALLPSNPPVSVPRCAAPAQEGGWSNVVTAWERWDGVWFTCIASHGYDADDGSAAFFPLYPLTIRTVAAIPGVGYLGAALVISNLAFLGALVVVYGLSKSEWGEHVARRATLFLAIFPTAFFFFAPYSESLFLLFAASSLGSARSGRWPLAGVTGALAAATRSIGLVLVVALAVEAVRQAFGRERDSGWNLQFAWSLGWSASVGLGTALYLLYWEIEAGNWRLPMTSQGGWARDPSLPPKTLVDGTREAFRFVGTYSGGYHLADWVIVMLALAAAVWVAVRLPATYAVYTWLSLLIPLSFVFGGRPFMSVPRFVVTIFPLFWAFAAFAVRWKAHDLVVAMSAGGLGVMTLLFVNWYYVF